MKSRTRNTLLGSLFIYGQFLTALAATFFVTPLILRTLGAREYGIWLSTGELVGYFLLLDFGVSAILPWLIARADGQQRRPELRQLLVNALAVALGLALLFSLVTLAAWDRLPGALRLTGGEWQALGGPLFLLVVLLLANLPLNLPLSLLAGLQDVRFVGALNLLKALLGPLLTAGLLLTGHGFYALALGTALLSPLGGVAAFVRARKLVPDLLQHWPAPTFGSTARLFRESIGSWLGSAGVQLMERSSAVVLVFMGSPTAVPVLVCTSRVGQILTQIAWVVPDSSLVGLAQLSGEGKPERVREVMLSIIRFSLLLAGLMACAVLAINPAFVRIWVGKQFFGGLTLNLLLAAEVCSATLTHALVTIIAVQGHRLSVGLATLLQGAIYILLALVLARRFFLEGLLLADLIAPLCSTVPLGLWVLRSSYDLGSRRIGSEIAPLMLRASPCLLAAWLYGRGRAEMASLPELVAVGLVIGFVYLRVMGSQLSTFPLPASAKTWLQRLRLV